jgi:hypothetical protein
MKKKLFIFVAVLSLAFTGCDYAEVESVNEVEEEPASSMFIEIENSYMWKVVYQRDTKVMYVVSDGSYNRGDFTVLVNPDGTPMLYKEEK